VFPFKCRKKKIAARFPFAFSLLLFPDLQLSPGLLSTTRPLMYYGSAQSLFIFKNLAAERVTLWSLKLQADTPYSSHSSPPDVCLLNIKKVGVFPPCQIKRIVRVFSVCTLFRYQPE
jgi:hypothetical protein